jgi:coenzyme F420-0:L-glutamate ligase / coenzyme F420-1:gamma-L-glutamate ligase
MRIKTADMTHDFLRSRCSIRKFQQKPVDETVLTRILETATHAPSAHNRQPWRFAVLTQPQPKSRLSEFLAAEFRRDLAADGLSETEVESRLKRSKNRILESPAIIILCMDASEMDVYPDDKRYAAERIMAIQSVAAAGLQLQLAAHAEGLGSVWTCGPLFAPEIVKQALDLPVAWEPQAMFFIGYPDETPKVKELKPLAEIVRWPK